MILISVGTKEIRYKIIRNNNLKLSNIKSTKAKEQKTSGFLSILKFIGIAIVATVAASLGQEWAAAGLAELGFSEFAVSTISSTLSASIEFSINEGYDVATQNSSASSTFFNALPFVSVLSAASKGLKFSKILSYANETGIFKDLNIPESEFKNIIKFSSALDGTKQFLGKDIYDFTKGSNEYKSLKLLSDLSKKSALNKILKNIKEGKNILDSDIRKIININVLLKETSPHLFSNIEDQFYKDTINLLDKNKIKLSNLRNENLFDDFISSLNLTSSEHSAKLIWTLYTIRQQKIIENSFTSVFSKILKKMYISAKILHSDEMIIEASKEAIEIIINKCEKKLANIIETLKQTKFYKISKSVLRRIKNINQMNKNKDLSKILIPVDSDIILGYKVKCLIDKTFVVIVLFQNINLEPRTFYWNNLQFDNWVSACNSKRVNEYYKSKIENEYSLNFFGLSLISKFMSQDILSFIKDGIATYKLFAKKTRKILNVKKINRVQTLQKEVIDRIKEKISLKMLSILFMKQLANKSAIELIKNRELKRMLNIFANQKIISVENINIKIKKD